MIPKTFQSPRTEDPSRSWKTALARILWWWLRGVEEYAFAQEGEAGAAVHLAFDHLDLVDVAFHGGGAVGQGEPGGDGFLVAADAAGEGVQRGQVAGFDLGEPVLEGEQALAAGHHLGEAGDVAGQGAQVRAAGRDGGEVCLVISVEVAGAGQQPAGDL